MIDPEAEVPESPDTADPTAAALRALAVVYADLEREIATRSPRCDLSGRCCDFPTSGHLLFASSLEVAYARSHGGNAPPEAPAALCPFWMKGRCDLREGRPLGCRVYFCDPAYADAMPEIAERYHRRIASLHDEHGVDYRYARFVESIRKP